MNDELEKVYPSEFIEQLNYHHFKKMIETHETKNWGFTSNQVTNYTARLLKELNNE
jgi:hypothetical protein